MTKAQQFVQRCSEARTQHKPLKPATFAKDLDPNYTKAHTDNYLFYYFSDSSTAGTSIRDGAGRRNFQAWEA